MPFIKLDCGILTSSLWTLEPDRMIFITALLMAHPCKLDSAKPQLKARSLERTGLIIPPGWYGFVPASATGIIRMAVLDDVAAGMAAIERLGEPDEDSRSDDFDGRRMVRINGGYLILNYQRYRDHDYSAAARQRAWRQRMKAGTVTANVTPVMRYVDKLVTPVTQAEAEAEVEADRYPIGQRSKAAALARSNDERLTVNRSSFNRSKENESEKHLMARLGELLGADEMKRAGGHWRKDWVRKQPKLLDRALADLESALREGREIENRGAWLEDLLKRWSK